MMHVTEKFFSKIIIRRLPPSMSADQLLEQISPVPEHNYFYFGKSDKSLGQFSFTWAVINFLQQQDMYLFKDKFDGYVFLDSKGNEYPAIVEFAPYQRIPKRRLNVNFSAKKFDSKSGTIDDDSDYKKFIEALEESINLPSAEVYLEEIEAREREAKANNGSNKITTPLIEFIKERKAERNRIREERREERKKQAEIKRLRDDEKREKELRSPLKLARKRDRKEKTRDRRGGEGRKNERKERDNERNADDEVVKRERDNNKSSNRNEHRYESRRNDKKREPRDDRKSSENVTFTVKVLHNSEKTEVAKIDENQIQNKSAESTQVGNRNENRMPNSQLEKSSLNDTGAKSTQYNSNDDQASRNFSSRHNRNETEKKNDGHRMRYRDRPAVEIYKPGMRRANSSTQNSSNQSYEISHISREYESRISDSCKDNESRRESQESRYDTCNSQVKSDPIENHEPKSNRDKPDNRRYRESKDRYRDNRRDSRNKDQRGKDRNRESKERKERGPKDRDNNHETCEGDVRESKEKDSALSEPREKADVLREPREKDHRRDSREKEMREPKERDNHRDSRDRENHRESRDRENRRDSRERDSHRSERGSRDSRERDSHRSEGRSERGSRDREYHQRERDHVRRTKVYTRSRNAE